MCCRAVRADVLDEHSPHHVPTAQSAAHASASHYADTKGLSWHSSQAHTKTQSTTFFIWPQNPTSTTIGTVTMNACV